MNTNTNKYFICLSALIFGIALVLYGPMIQDSHYHHFADERNLCIPNTWNVWSNLPFLIIGIGGIVHLIINGKYLTGFQKINYATLYVGIALTALGSAYYHWNPTEWTLLWDRTPMTLVFASFFAMVAADVTDTAFGQKVFWMFLCLGIVSMIIWQFNGDLRIYFFAQFFPAVMIILLLILRKIPSNIQSYILGILATYVLAKVFEHYDLETYQVLQRSISGHTIKHLFAAATTFIIVKYAIFNIYKLNHQ